MTIHIWREEGVVNEGRREDVREGWEKVRNNESDRVRRGGGGR